MLPMAGRLDLTRVVPTLMRMLGISRGHILDDHVKIIDQLTIWRASAKRSKYDMIISILNSDFLRTCYLIHSIFTSDY